MDEMVYKKIGDIVKIVSEIDGKPTITYRLENLPPSVDFSHIVDEKSDVFGHTVITTYISPHEFVTYYADTGEPYDRDLPPRPCKSCGRLQTVEGHDPCIRNLPGVKNACCGHGIDKYAYVHFEDGNTLYEKDALEFFNGLI